MSSSQKALLWPVCRLWLARSRSFLFPPPGSVRWHHTAPFSWHLSAYPPGWHPTATHRLAPYCPVAPLASLSTPSDAFLLGYAQSWYCTASVAAANALVKQCNYQRDRCLRLRYQPTFLWFSSKARSLSSLSGPRFEALAKLSVVQGSIRKGLDLSTCTFLCIVSLRVWRLLS